MYLASTLLPIVTAKWDQSPCIAYGFHGTGFLVSNNGHFLTAKHVLEGAFAFASENGYCAAAVIRQDDGRSPDSAFARILDFEFAPEPYDVAICKVTYKAETDFRILKKPEDNLWLDVASYGYPDSVIGRDILPSGHPDMELSIRALKGHIQREVKAYKGSLGDHPKGFELSFLISRGMSGSPVFRYTPEIMQVIGIAVGSKRSEFTADEILEYELNGKLYFERKVKIEEYGFAHSLEDLYEWTPRLLSGLPLCEAYLA